MSNCESLPVKGADLDKTGGQAQSEPRDPGRLYSLILTSLPAAAGRSGFVRPGQSEREYTFRPVSETGLPTASCSCMSELKGCLTRCRQSQVSGFRLAKLHRKTIKDAPGTCMLILKATVVARQQQQGPSTLRTLTKYFSTGIPLAIPCTYIDRRQRQRQG